MRTLLATVLAAAVLPIPLLASPASAAPPVAVDDHVTMWVGGLSTADVLANDSDPDGDGLRVCRVGALTGSGYSLMNTTGDALEVLVHEGASDVITIQYYACDFETLVPATLTISTRAADAVRVAKVARPGLLRVRNPNDHAVQFQWGSPRPTPDYDEITIAGNDSVLVPVHRRRIFWGAYFGRHYSAGSGEVRGIELPKEHRR